MVAPQVREIWVSLCGNCGRDYRAEDAQTAFRTLLAHTQVAHPGPVQELQVWNELSALPVKL